MGSSPPSDRRALLGAIAADLVAVVVFAAAGRNAHDESSGIAAVATIAAPFLIGILAGWVAVPVVRRAPLSIRAGVAVWLATVGIGLLVRRTLWDRGTAVSFVVVATLVLGALIVGWRIVWERTRRRGGIVSESPPSKAGR